MEMAKEILSLKQDFCADSFTVPSFFPPTVNENTSVYYKVRIRESILKLQVSHSDIFRTEVDYEGLIKGYIFPEFPSPHISPGNLYSKLK